MASRIRQMGRPRVVPTPAAHLSSASTRAPSEGSCSMRSAHVIVDAVLGNVKPPLPLPRGHDVGALNHQVRPVE